MNPRVRMELKWAKKGGGGGAKFSLVNSFLLKNSNDIIVQAP